MQTSSLFLERTVVETLNWLSQLKWTTVLERLPEWETVIRSPVHRTQKHLESHGEPFVVGPFLGMQRGGHGRGGHFITFTNHGGALRLGGLAEARIQPRQPSPTASSFSYMCSHYPAVCCCNAPINFPLDILRAIYKSCRLSFVTSLMLGNNAAAAVMGPSG